VSPLRLLSAGLLLVPLAFFGGRLWSPATTAGEPGSSNRAVGASPRCEMVETDIALPDELEETSGLGVGIRNPEVFWSQNDGGAFVVGFDGEGRQVARFEIESPNRDWEAMEVVPCEERSCILIADTGDNQEHRDDLALVRMAEPSPDVTSVDPRRYRIALPDGPRDMEAMYALPGERLFFVTKGRNDRVTVYRYPGELRDLEDPVVLEELQVLGTPANPLEWITGAGASRDGGFVAVRSYASLYLYRVRDDGTLELLPDGRFGLLGLGEAQGEAVAFGSDGLLYLTSEQRNGEAPEMNVLRCRLDDQDDS